MYKMKIKLVKFEAYFFTYYPFQWWPQWPQCLRIHLDLTVLIRFTGGTRNIRKLVI